MTLGNCPYCVPTMTEEHAPNCPLRVPQMLVLDSPSALQMDTQGRVVLVADASTLERLAQALRDARGETGPVECYALVQAAHEALVLCRGKLTFGALDRLEQALLPFARWISAAEADE